MTEDINFRAFKASHSNTHQARKLRSAIAISGGIPRIAKFLETRSVAQKFRSTRMTPLNAALNISLKLDVGAATKDSPAGIANGGYWGIPVKPNTKYHASFYAKTEEDFQRRVDVCKFKARTAKQFLPAQKFPASTGDWKKFEATLDNEANMYAVERKSIW